MKPTLSDYVIRLNPQRLYNIIIGAMIPVFIFGCVLSALYGISGFIILIVLILTGLITLIYAIPPENNVLVFTEDAIVLHIEAGSTSLTYSYTDLKKITLTKKIKQRGYIALEFAPKMYRGNLHRKDGLDASFSNFVLLLFEKNPKLECFGDFSLERYKYFMLNGEVREVLL